MRPLDRIYAIAVAYTHRAAGVETDILYSDPEQIARYRSFDKQRPGNRIVTFHIQFLKIVSVCSDLFVIAIRAAKAHRLLRRGKSGWQHVRPEEKLFVLFSYCQQKINSCLFLYSPLSVRHIFRRLPVDLPSGCRAASPPATGACGFFRRRAQNNRWLKPFYRILSASQQAKLLWSTLRRIQILCHGRKINGAAAKQMILILFCSSSVCQ